MLVLSLSWPPYNVQIKKEVSLRINGSLQTKGIVRMYQRLFLILLGEGDGGKWSACHVEERLTLQPLINILYSCSDYR